MRNGGGMYVPCINLCFLCCVPVLNLRNKGGPSVLLAPHPWGQKILENQFHQGAWQIHLYTSFKQCRGWKWEIVRCFSPGTWDVQWNGNLLEVLEGGFRRTALQATTRHTMNGCWTCCRDRLLEMNLTHLLEDISHSEATASRSARRATWFWCWKHVQPRGSEIWSTLGTHNRIINYCAASQLTHAHSVFEACFVQGFKIKKRGNPWKTPENLENCWPNQTHDLAGCRTQFSRVARWPSTWFVWPFAARIGARTSSRAHGVHINLNICGVEPAKRSSKFFLVSWWAWIFFWLMIFNRQLASDRK